MDPLELLRRRDKWFLGGGQGAIYAPPFPRWLTTPGFWDECYLADIRVPRLFTALFLSQGKAVRFDSKVVDWRPDRLILEHRSEGIRVRETRCVTETNAWVSHFEVLQSAGVLQVVQWALFDVRQPGYGAPWASLTDATVLEGGFGIRFETAWPSELEADRTAVENEQISGQSGMLPSLPVFLRFGGSASRQSWTVNLAQRHDESPLYELSLLPTKLRDGRLPGDFKLWVGPEPVEGFAHLLQLYEVAPGGLITLACGAGLTESDAVAAIGDALAPGVLERSEADWSAYFASVPQFFSSNPWLTNAYWYRWYGLRLNTVDIEGLPVCRGLASGDQDTPPPPARLPGERGGVFSPYVTEGIGFFRNFITYSAQAHLREVSWMHDPALALGILDNLGKVQRDDGSFPGHNYSARPPRDFYHADFATGYNQLRALHGLELLEAPETALLKYAWYMASQRATGDRRSTMIDVFDQNETGQEYMSRYQVVSERADQWASFRVGGVDATTYMSEVPVAGASWNGVDPVGLATRCRRGLRELSWNPEELFFCDVLPGGEKSSARPAAGLYPLMLSPRFLEKLGTEQACACVERWLLNEREFWLPKGFPATAASDSTFSAEGEWKEKRLNCPWNGRSWPMVNSHLVDGIANVARTFGREDLRAKAGEALMKAVRLMFHEGDPARPNSYEHYDPITGVPALYRGYDDYMHSWIVDLILRHAVGVEPGQDEVDPL
ncbi:MAG TPA: hypothetical protein VK934_03280, partial [Fimbriimonas sp.]|nr:hypothetical protein [Fimbriimonas sp.]